MGQNGQKENGDLGVGDVHDDAATVELPVIQFHIVAALDFFSTGTKGVPGQIQKITGADSLSASHTFWKELALKPEALHSYTSLD